MSHCCWSHLNTHPGGNSSWRRQWRSLPAPWAQDRLHTPQPFCLLGQSFPTSGRELRAACPCCPMTDPSVGLQHRGVKPISVILWGTPAKSAAINRMSPAVYSCLWSFHCTTTSAACRWLRWDEGNPAPRISSSWKKTHTVLQVLHFSILLCMIAVNTSTILLDALRELCLGRAFSLCIQTAFEFYRLFMHNDSEVQPFPSEYRSKICQMLVQLFCNVLFYMLAVSLCVYPCPFWKNWKKN